MSNLVSERFTPFFAKRTNLETMATCADSEFPVTLDEPSLEEKDDITNEDDYETQQSSDGNLKTPPNSPIRVIPCSGSVNVKTPKGAWSKVPMARKLLTPNPDGEDPDDIIEEADMLPQIYISKKSYTFEERVVLYCDKMIGPCSVSRAFVS